MTKVTTAKTAPMTAEEKFQKKLELTRPYYESPRDEEFPWLLSQQTSNFNARLAGGGVKECALVILGDSNSGKTKMLEYHMSKFPDLQPRIGADGKTYPRVLMTEAPGSCTNKSVAIAMLSPMGIQATTRASEFELFSILKRALKINKYECVVVDEMQHAIRGTQKATIKKVQDVFKSLLQIDDWPIHFIFVGTHELSRFLLGDRQLANRCNVMRIHPLNYKNRDHIAFAEKLVTKIVVETGEMEIGWDDRELLSKRLVRAASGALGAVIKLTQQACFFAIDNDRRIVTIQDFADVYRLKSGCIKADNIFLSADWELLNPAKAVADLDVEQ